MKKIISLGVIGAMALSTLSVSAMEMMSDSSMMMKKEDGMMMKSDTMMKSDGMMMDHSMSMGMKNMSVVMVAKSLGYTWKSDRAKLAKMAGIKQYRGTASQNMMLRKYLLSVSMEGVMVGGATPLSCHWMGSHC